MLIVALFGPIARLEIPNLCERLSGYLKGGGAERVICDVGTLVDPDATTVEALARLYLTSRRRGSQFRLRDVGLELAELLGFVGLRDVLPLERASALQPRRQAEQREQARRIQEEADSGDPTA